MSNPLISAQIARLRAEIAAHSVQIGRHSKMAAEKQEALDHLLKADATVPAKPAPAAAPAAKPAPAADAPKPAAPVAAAASTK